jgi:hypothetical protein
MLRLRAAPDVVSIAVYGQAGRRVNGVRLLVLKDYDAYKSTTPREFPGWRAGVSLMAVRAFSVESLASGFSDWRTYDKEPMLFVSPRRDRGTTDV